MLLKTDMPASDDDGGWGGRLDLPNNNNAQ